MKKLLITGVVFIISMGAFATGYLNKQEVAYGQEKSKLKDCVIMKDGAMYVVKDGEQTEMLKAVIMSNGTKVLANGEVFLKNGETFKLENGDVVYMNGKLEKKGAGNSAG
jgi:hypothetical protein